MTWTAEKYFAKAQLYWTRASSVGRDDPTFLLHAAFALEFVVRGCLCVINPALNAASDPESLLFATGVSPLKPARTIALGDALGRLRRHVPTITDEETNALNLLIDARNSELHDDTDSLDIASKDAILPSLYSFLVKVLTNAKIDVEDVLTDDAAQAKQVALAATKDRKRRVQGLLQGCKDRFYTRAQAEQEELRKQTETTFVSAVMKDGRHLRRHLCPACKSQGLIVGTPIGRSAPILREDSIVREVRVVPSGFECRACELKIVGLDELMAAGFPHEFLTVDDIDPVEHLSIDPMEYVDIDEIIREHGQDRYEYQDE